jgi:predicted RNA binding protein YcfA (HicA-like mRNA interferase family)
MPQPKSSVELADAEKEAPGPSNPPQAKPVRPHHELDGIKRGGWTPGDFHRLLQSHGFDTSEVSGGGHCFVKCGGEKLRHPDGRFLVVTHRTSGTEITPGTANKILKVCADFLVLRAGRAAQLPP